MVTLPKQKSHVPCRPSNGVAQNVLILPFSALSFSIGGLAMALLIPAATRSIWSATTDIATPPPLHGSTTADVCIIGAGIAGLTTAYLLGRQGKKVIVIDDGRLGGGETRVTTAHLASAIDDRFT